MHDERARRLLLPLELEERLVRGGEFAIGSLELACALLDAPLQLGVDLDLLHGHRGAVGERLEDRQSLRRRERFAAQ